MASSGASSSSIVESPPSGPYVILAQSWIVSPFSSHLTEEVASAEGCGSRDSLRTLVSAVPGLRCSAILMPPIRFARSAFGGSDRLAAHRSSALATGSGGCCFPRR